MAADRASRAVPFPEMGADLCLRYTTKDLIDLEQFCPPESPTEAWTAAIERQLRRQSISFVREAIRLGLKSPGGFNRPQGIDFNDLPVTANTATQPIADAIRCAITGESYADVVAEREAAQAKAGLHIEEREGGLSITGSIAEREAAASAEA